MPRRQVEQAQSASGVKVYGILELILKYASFGRGTGPRHRGNQWKTASEMTIYSIPANKSKITQIGRRSMPRRQVNQVQSASKAKVCSIPVSKHSTSPIGRRLMLWHMWILYRIRRRPVLETPESEKLQTVRRRCHSAHFTVSYYSRKPRCRLCCKSKYMKNIC